MTTVFVKRVPYCYRFEILSYGIFIYGRPLFIKSRLVRKWGRNYNNNVLLPFNFFKLYNYLILSKFPICSAQPFSFVFNNTIV